VFSTILLFTCVWTNGNEIDKEQLFMSYKRSFSKVHSFDITYAKGHVTHWDEWHFRLMEQTRWRKSGLNERVDRTKRTVHVILAEPKQDVVENHPQSTHVVIPVESEYTNGTKVWKLSGNLIENDKIDLLDQKGLHAEIQQISSEDILRGFPYFDFSYSFILGKKTYSLEQIFTEFDTEIINCRQEINRNLITTRSFLQGKENNSNGLFVQITFDSSIDYLPRQIAFPVDINIDRGIYIVRDFIEYYHSEDGALFPMKITSSLTNNIVKLTDLEPKGKVAIINISLNKPIEIPEIEFPQGLVVSINDETGLTSYIWGEDNKPLKKLTSEDYELVKKEMGKKVKRPLNLSIYEYIRIVFIITGIVIILFVIFLKRKNQKN
jgi:hypothetical protein